MKTTSTPSTEERRSHGADAPVTPLAAAVTTAAERDARRYVITGGPSSGKDELIEVILAAGIPCMEAEPGREIYRKHRERLGRHLRREDRHEYSLEVLQAFISEFSAHKTGIRFYNRGIPDGYGWDSFFGLGPTPQLEEASRLFRYDTIFVLDPLDTPAQTQPGATMTTTRVATAPTPVTAPALLTSPTITPSAPRASTR